MHHVFNQAFVVAALMLIVAFVLMLRLGGGRASERIISPYEALGE
jgi:hypothetical protein